MRQKVKQSVQILNSESQSLGAYSHLYKDADEFHDGYPRYHPHHRHWTASSALCPGNLHSVGPGCDKSDRRVFFGHISRGDVYTLNRLPKRGIDAGQASPMRSASSDH